MKTKLEDATEEETEKENLILYSLKYCFFKSELFLWCCNIYFTSLSAGAWRIICTKPILVGVTDMILLHACDMSITTLRTINLQ